QAHKSSGSPHVLQITAISSMSDALTYY
ncbi:uncharacterized protein METZ01_LOCUS160950, partial [marine metagenome]